MHSLRHRVLLFSVLFITALILSITIPSYEYSKNLMRKQIDATMNTRMNAVKNHISLELLRHARIPESLARIAESIGTRLTREQYFDLLKRSLTQNRSTFGVGVWFEPFAYKPDTRFFGPYVYREKETTKATAEYESEKYNFHGQEWYAIGKTAEKSVVWSKPFYDEATAVTMLTANAPFYGPAHTYLGSASGDIDINRIQEFVSGLKIGKTGRAAVIGTDGLFIMHPDKTRQMKKKIQEDENPSIVNAGKTMASKTEGVTSFNDKGGRNLVYFTKLEETGWTIALVIPEKDLYSDLTSLFIIFVTIAVIFLCAAGIIVYRLSGRIVHPVEKTNTELKRLSLGDISVTGREKDTLKETAEKETGGYEIAELEKNHAMFILSLREIITGTQDIAASLASSTEESSQTLSSFSETVQNQAATTEEITATISELTGSMESIALSAEDQYSELGALIERFRELSSSIGKMESVITNALMQSKSMTVELKSGDDSIRSMNENMRKISESSNAMTGIVEMITNISAQINLLSLNAAIEAARAGDAGRGFAVVADEISKLADQTSSSIKEISGFIKGNEDEITKGMSTVMESIRIISSIIQGINTIGETITGINTFMQMQVETNSKINKDVDNVKKKSDEIRLAMNEQKIAVEEVSKSVNSINENIQSNAAGAEEMNATVENIAKMASELKTRMDFFRT
jgi:methyl-accepting chemotaxis protein